MNYYNEFDKHAAQWLRNLIAGGMIPAGDVDERSIEDVRASDLRGYTQCHFFAGIGGWSEALRLAGWQADRPVWTGSCPCQPFSVAGRRKGTDDKRHLWPIWHELIKACKPPVIFGEQVDAAIKHEWLDTVAKDLESDCYTFGAGIIPAAGIGAPHIRKRLWFIAILLDNAIPLGWKPWGHRNNQEHDGFKSGAVIENGIVANCNEPGLQRREPVRCTSQRSIGSNRMDDRHLLIPGRKISGRNAEKTRETGGNWEKELIPGESWGASSNVFWAGSDWIECTDGKQRPFKPGVLPLADGVPGRMVKIRGYGNAIVPQVAAEVIKAGMAYLKEVMV